MTIYRYELSALKEWGKQTNRKPIILRGARQVGKSTLVQVLAKELDLHLVTIDFERRPEFADLFTSNDPKQIIKLLQIRYKTDFVPGETLLFLDEVQGVADVIFTALRYFYEDLPELHVIAAGSLLDFSLVEATFSMPVGRVEYRYIGPLFFEEFLLALNENYLLEFLKNYHLGDPLPAVLHEQLTELLHQFCIIGGMPEAVAAFAKNQDYMMSEQVKHAILNTYQDDFSKYSRSPDRLRKIFNKLPSLVGNKIKYSHLIQDEKSTVIAAALEKLCLARVAYLVKHSACNGIPLGAEVNEKIFKPLVLDVGLMASSLGLNLLQLSAKEKVVFANLGAVAEQFIGQHLLYLNPSYQEPRLYYWTREKRNSNAEIDYVMTIGTHILPIEVKGGKSGTLRSLHYFLREKSLPLGIRLNAHFPQLTKETAVFTDGADYPYRLLSLPLYLVGQLPRLFAEIVWD